MTLRALLDRTVGRSLIVRISLHGMVLFAAMLAIIVVTRFVLPGADALAAMYTHPRFAAGLADRALASRHDPAALRRELVAIEAETGLAIAVFEPAGRLIAAAHEPPPAPATASELAHLTRAATANHGRFVTGAFDGDRLVAYAVSRMHAIPSITSHVVVLALAALVLAFGLVGLPIAWSLARPIRELDRLAKQLGAGDLAVRAPAERRDEIGDLARSFNAMAAQIQRLRASERELLGDVSHELRTPLARMRVVLDLADDAEPARLRRYLREITTDLGELEQLLDDIITSSRLDPLARHWDEARPPLRLRTLDARDLVDAAAVRFRDRWPDRALVCQGAGDPLIVDGDPVILRRALDNLVDNARKYSGDGHPIVVRVDRESLRGAPAVRIEVIDEGIGIALEDQPRVFTPFFRADRSRTRATGGVGLGLALARRIVEVHGGTIDFASEHARGSRFWFVLPLAAA